MLCYQVEEKWPVIKTTTLKGTAQGAISREVKWRAGLCPHCESSVGGSVLLVYGAVFCASMEQGSDEGDSG